MNDAKELIILVDQDDNEIGTGSKLEMHERGILHRAFSIYIFDAEGKLLLQKRAASKYHSAGLWANTCCGHQRSGEDTKAAAHRRLQEEMGFDCPLERLPDTIYRAPLGNGMTEHEYLHVFVGRYDGEPKPAPEEVAEVRRMTLDELEADTAAAPERYAAWFPLILPHVRAHLPH